jgi:hypothetical protein
MNVCCRPVGCPETWPGLGSLRRRAWRVPHPPRQAILPVKMSEPLPNRGACHFLMPGVQELAEGMRVSRVPHCGGWLRAGTRRRFLARLRVPWENQTLHRLAKAAGNLTLMGDPFQPKLAVDIPALLCQHRGMLAGTEKPSLPHPCSAEYVRARKKHTPVSFGL